MEKSIKAKIVQLRKTCNLIKYLSEEFSKKQYSMWTLSAFIIFYNHILDILTELFRNDGVVINSQKDVIMQAAKEGIILNVEPWFFLLEKITQAQLSNEEKVLREILLVLPAFKNSLLLVVKALEIRLILGIQMFSPKVEE